jgi:hypothetical protein
VANYAYCLSLIKIPKDLKQIIHNSYPKRILNIFELFIDIDLCTSGLGFRAGATYGDSVAR